jgi:hypothetical protein
MANTINTNNGLSLTVIAQEALPFLNPIAAKLDLFSTDFSGEVGAVGAAVATRIVTPMTASSYDATTGYASVAGTTTAVTTTLNNHTYRTVAFTPVEMATIGIDKLTQTYIAPAIAAVGNEVVKQLYTLATATNYPVASYSGSAGGFNYAAILSGSQVLDLSGSNAPRATVLNPRLYMPVVSELKQNYVIGDSTVIRNGELGLLDNSWTVKDSLLPSNGQGLAGFVAGKDAFAIATRVPPAPGPGVEVENIVGPGGLTLQVQRYYVNHLGQYHITVGLIWGVAKGNGSSLVRFIDSGNP